MHTATGIYGVDRIGRTTVPTADRIDATERTIARVNDTRIPDTGTERHLRAGDLKFAVAIDPSERRSRIEATVIGTREGP